MRYYPLFLNLEKKSVVVIGGGRVAERKIASLIKGGARVTVVSPRMTSRLTRWKAAGSLDALARPYRRGDLKGALLAFAATDDADVNEAVAREAARRGILFNRADRADTSGFIVPASFSREGVTVAVSTAGKSPALAKALRDHLRAAVPPRTAWAVKHLAAIKRALARKGIPGEKRKVILTRLAESNLSLLYQQGEIKKAEALVLKISGLRRAELPGPPSKQRGI